MALLLQLGGVGKYVSMIWRWSVYPRESGDLHRPQYRQMYSSRASLLHADMAIVDALSFLSQSISDMILSSDVDKAFKSMSTWLNNEGEQN